MTPVGGYAAFISYAHVDERWARWLHRRIEAWRTPKRLVGTAGEHGPVPARLRPVFRDRDELASAGDLGARVGAALAASQALIVLCSPTAAASRWVNEEVRRFKQAHGDARVFALLLDGEPGDSKRECFVPALTRNIDAQGVAGEAVVEPLAADIRPRKDGRRGALLKLLAGLLGVPLDELVRREQVRRQRRLLAITIVSLLGMVIAFGLAALAVVARHDAQRRQAQAEDLVGFMLTDLKQQLETVQRLDILDAAAGKADAYFAGLSVRDLNDASLRLNAEALRQLGDLRMRRQQWVPARTAFARALALDQQRLARAPNDPQRVFDSAQSEFWLGNLAYETGQYDEAQKHFLAYAAAAERLYAMAPENPAWLMERSYAHSNLAALYAKTNRLNEAVQQAQLGVQFERLALLLAPNDAGLHTQLSDSLSLLATAQSAAGLHADAVATRAEVTARRRALLALRANDWRLRLELARALRGEGNALRLVGRSAEALQRLHDAGTIGLQLIAHDPANKAWRWDYAGMLLDAARARIEADPDAVLVASERDALTAAQAVDATGVANQAADRWLAQALLGRDQVQAGQVAAGLAQLQAALSGMAALHAANPDDDALLAQQIELALLRESVLRGVQREDRATLDALADALQAMPTPSRKTYDQVRFALLLIEVGRIDAARPLVERLIAQGLRLPSLLRACARVDLCSAAARQP